MPRVLILMATHNGERFLVNQLTSIVKQSHENWRLVVSDDGSTDSTFFLLDSFRQSRPKGQVTVLQGPCQGAVENFRSLIRGTDLQGDYLAFSDQDDVWHDDHLKRGLDALARIDNPLALYGSRMQVCDATLTPFGLSPLPKRPLGFRNALVQNVLSGNTQVMTPDAAVLLQEAETDGGPMVVHDWWAYQVITGAGGKAVFDSCPGLLYRQHDTNVIGANRGLHSLNQRVRRYLNGTHGRWARRNCKSLMASQMRFKPENRRYLTDFAAGLHQPLVGRIRMIRTSGIYHQRKRAHAAFWLLVLLGLY